METARAWGIGVNWYLNKNLKLAANYEQTYFRKSALSAGAVRPDEKTFLQRLQFAF
jgi:phosphate-selective porin OprO/OprP